MPDDQEKIIKSLLSSPPEQVFSMFQNDLRRPISSIQACISLLSEVDNTEEEKKRIIEILQAESQQVTDALDFALAYLKKFHELKHGSKPNLE